MHNGFVYYTDDQLNPVIRDLVLASIHAGSELMDGVRIYPLDDEKPGVLTMHRQILRGLESLGGFDVIFLCEHDVIYHPSHFDFVPLRSDTFYYNVNVLHVRWPDGYAVAWDDCQQVSGLCASRELLLDYYRQRIAQIEHEGFNRHYEPGLKQTVGGQRVENWKSEMPNLDIRHGGNLTKSKWSPMDFRNARYAVGWREMDKAPGWDEIVGVPG